MKKCEDLHWGARRGSTALIFRVTSRKLCGLRPVGRYRGVQAMKKSFAKAYGIVDIGDFDYVAITLMKMRR